MNNVGKQSLQTNSKTLFIILALTIILTTNTLAITIFEDTFNRTNNLTIGNNWEEETEPDGVNNIGEINNSQMRLYASNNQYTIVNHQLENSTPTKINTTFYIPTDLNNPSFATIYFCEEKCGTLQSGRIAFTFARSAVMNSNIDNIKISNASNTIEHNINPNETISLEYTNVNTTTFTYDIFVKINNGTTNYTYTNLMFTENVSYINNTRILVDDNNAQNIDFRMSYFGAYNDVCLPSYYCSIYGTCNSSNILPCSLVEDYNNCGILYPMANFSDYDTNCSYTPPLTGYQPTYTADDVPSIVIDTGGKIASGTGQSGAIIGFLIFLALLISVLGFLFFLMKKKR